MCTRCAGIHRSMGAHISKVKHLKLDRWEDSQVNRIREVGNITARLHYEERVPPCYRRPNPDAPQYVVSYISNMQLEVNVYLKSNILTLTEYW